MVKKVLIITYFFPPNPEIASVRLGGLAKFLPESGWEPTILTPRLSLPFDQECRVITTDPSDLLIEWKQKFGFAVTKTMREQLGAINKKDTLIDYCLNFTKEIIAYPDYCKGWYRKAMPVARHLLNNKKFDAIVSSAGPYTAHIIAHDLKKEFNIPWVADFRDLWTQDHHYSYTVFRKFFERRLEKRILSNADVITTVSEPLAKKLKEIHLSPIETITNGFDPDILNKSDEHSLKFSIRYTGRIYRHVMDPEPLFRVIHSLITEEIIVPNDVTIQFWGFFEPYLNEIVNKYDLNKIVKFHIKVPHDQAISIQRTAQILLLLGWNNPKERGILTGKIYEYLAAKRPILAIGKIEDEIADLLNETKTGVFIKTDEDLRRILIEWYHQYKKFGTVYYQGIEDEIKNYSYQEITRDFAHILDRIVANSH